MCERQRDLDVYLQGDHREEIYRALRDDRANHRRELQRADAIVRTPSDDEERG